jgi:hypothetical protein
MKSLSYSIKADGKQYFFEGLTLFATMKRKTWHGSTMIDLRFII